MNLSLVFLYDKIEKLRYNSVSLEFPVPDIISFDYKTILDPPPSNTDPKTLKELNFVAESTFNRSDADISPDRLFWMVEMGYPQAEIESYGDYFIVRSWPYNQETDNIEIRKKINLEDEQRIV